MVRFDRPIARCVYGWVCSLAIVALLMLTPTPAWCGKAGFLWVGLFGNSSNANPPPGVLRYAGKQLKKSGSPPQFGIATFNEFDGVVFDQKQNLWATVIDLNIG